MTDSEVYYPNDINPIREMAETKKQLYGQGWISVEERLPEPYTEVVVMNNYKDFQVAICEIRIYPESHMTLNSLELIEMGINPNFRHWDYTKIFFEPTHWMPLPLPPGDAK